jgi:hypothetical protein
VNAVDTSSGVANYFTSIEDWPNGVGDVDDGLNGPDGDFQANGGISGVVLYGVTRAENDPRLAAAEEWESGVPRVQVNLYRDVWCASNGFPAIFPICPESAPGGEVGDGVPDDKTGNGNVEYADVDNYPLDWAPEHCSSGCAPGPEDVDRNSNGDFDEGDAILVTWTDSWDESLPDSCTGNNVVPAVVNGTQVPIDQCAEGIRTWNQSRPAVFDGGYAFGPGEPLMVSGTYIVEAATPSGYEIVKEEDRNVDFGITPTPAILPASCVGDDHVVPALFSFLTRPNPILGDPPLALPGVDEQDPDNEAPFAGLARALCDRKKVDLGAGQNSAVDFFVFTDVPKAARGVGNINDDLANEVDPNRPAFSEKYTPPWTNIAVFDYSKQEINRTSGDEFGAYNFLAPSNYNVNLPTPTGIGPKMHQFCLNHPGPIPDAPQNNDPVNNLDPSFDFRYGTACYNFNFETARTTYLDTPVIRQAAFVGPQVEDLSCELPSGNPAIRDVRVLGGAWGPVASVGDVIRVRSMRNESGLRNPSFPGSGPEFTLLNHGFGGVKGTACVDYVDGGGEQTYCFDQTTEISLWKNGRVNLVIPTALEGITGQLTITRSSGKSTQVGITLTVQPAAGAATVRQVSCNPDGGICQNSIQAKIDAANPGDLVVVSPGTYQELPIINKRIKLQGSGAGATRIWGSPFPFAPHVGVPLDIWQANIDSMANLGNVPRLAPTILVAPTAGAFGTSTDANDRARIDGFQLMLNSQGGAVNATANASGLVISNNEMTSNQGDLAGGIQIGNPFVANNANPNVIVRNNDVHQNGSFNTAGGIGIYGGASNYSVRENRVCGNLARTGGGGISHRGFSDGGEIVDNDIVFNELFQGGVAAPGLGLAVNGGGGIDVAGLGVEIGLGLTTGSGSVLIDGNLIQGNQSGIADGGGIALSNINGEDVAASPADPASWNQVQVTNNFIINNVTGVAGGGIGLQDAVGAVVIHNTVANNDSTATGAGAFENGLGADSIAQPAGIAARPHSLGLLSAFGATPNTGFSSPIELRRNLLNNNRSYSFLITAPTPGLSAPSVWDFGVTTGEDCLVPTETRLTLIIPGVDPANCNYVGNANGALANARFKSPYFNDYITGVAADEGGNFVEAIFSPLGVQGNYHLRNNSQAINKAPVASASTPPLDIDGDDRPLGTFPDTGADEVK